MTRFGTTTILTLLMSMFGSGAHAGWDLTFDDEFAGTALNTAKWTTTYRYGDRSLSGNAELECYMDGNVTVSGGYLNLQAKKQTVSCPKPAATYNYTSGAIASFDKFSQQYGYFEMRAKLPAGKGLWPAFWLLTQSGVWPPEIDVMENLGNTPARMYMTMHYTDSAGHEQSSSYVDISNTSAFHTYGVDWASGTMKWYIDGVLVKSLSSNYVPKEPMYILANLAVGGSWPGSPDATTVFPSTMQVDYIRAFSRVSNGVSDTTPPFGKGVAVAIMQPTAGATLKPSTWTTLSATPIDASKVTFYAGSAKICDVSNSPYNCSYLTPSTAGSVVIKAVATSSSGTSNSTTSTITIANPTPLSVKVAQPTNGAVLKTSFWTTLSASATAAAKVTFYAGSTVVCTVTKAPYNCSYLTPKAAASVVIKAVATSSSGATVQATSTISVKP